MVKHLNIIKYIKMVFAIYYIIHCSLKVYLVNHILVFYTFILILQSKHNSLLYMSMS